MAEACVSSKCLFCKIASGNDSSTEILYEDDQFVAFRDIKPAAAHHYLIVTKRHIANAKVLSSSDKPLVEELVRVGRGVLEKQGASVSDSRFGFHWPPFTSISHLHLHALSPVSDAGLMTRAMFRPNSWWFVTADWLINRLTPKVE